MEIKLQTSGAGTKPLMVKNIDNPNFRKKVTGKKMPMK
jgi:hypothetical protein